LSANHGTAKPVVEGGDYGPWSGIAAVHDMHRIRLDGNWKRTAAEVGGAPPGLSAWTRTFHWVAPLQPDAPILLALSGLVPGTQVVLNGRVLGVAAESGARFAVAADLRRSNQLVLVFPAGPPHDEAAHPSAALGALGDMHEPRRSFNVWLEIGA
jgi:hypothetical protein